MKSKRITAILLGMLFVLSALAGCNGAPTDATDPVTAAEGTAVTEPITDQIGRAHV